MNATRPAKAYPQWKDLKDLLTQIQADEKAPGMAAAFARDGKIVAQAVVGVREFGKPDAVQADDRWNIGSVGKTMTSTLIGLLIDQGKLRWDSTLRELLPEVKMRPEYEKATIEQILQHRSGLPQEMNYTRAYVEKVTKDAKTPTEMRASYIADLLQREGVGKPGERFAYSNGGYALLGHIAERVMGKPYEALMQELLFTPLGMKTAVVGNPGDSGQPKGHIRTPNGLETVSFAGNLSMMVAPAGNISCSIGDLARFAVFHLEGMRGNARLLKLETFQHLHTPPTVPPGQEQYACGWEIVGEHTPEPFQGHGGSNGTFHAHIALFPKQNIAIVAAQNAGSDQSEPPAPLQVVLALEKKLRK